MIVSMWMTRDPLTIRPHTPLAEAAALMAARNIRRLPIVEPHPEGDHPVGIVSASDLLRAAPAGVNPLAGNAAPPLAGKAGDMMRAKLLTIAADAPIEAAATLMQSRKIGALPVLRGPILAGIITESDVFRAFASLFAGAPGDARITFDMSQGEDTFGLIARLVPRRKVRIESLFSTMQDELPVCVVRVSGKDVDALLEDLWDSGHRVLNVLRL